MGVCEKVWIGGISERLWSSSLILSSILNWLYIEILSFSIHNHSLDKLFIESKISLLTSEQ